MTLIERVDNLTKHTDDVKLQFNDMLKSKGINLTNPDFEEMVGEVNGLNSLVISEDSKVFTLLAKEGSPAYVKIMGYSGLSEVISIEQRRPILTSGHYQEVKSDMVINGVTYNAVNERTVRYGGSNIDNPPTVDVVVGKCKFTDIGDVVIRPSAKDINMNNGRVLDMDVTLKNIQVELYEVISVK